MNKNKLVSVIMSTYNSEKYISKAIESILKQSYKNFEFLIIDDNSTDKTLEIIQKFENLDKRIRSYKNLTNLGLTKSLNKAIALSQGNFIARQDDDDISYEKRLESQIKYVTKFNYDVCFSRARIIKNNQLIPKFSCYLPNKVVVNYKNPFIHGTLIIKKNILNKMGNYNEKFYYSQDYYLFKKLILNNVKIKYIKKPLYFLNTENNISSQFSNEQKFYSECVKKDIDPEDELNKV